MTQHKLKHSVIITAITLLPTISLAQVSDSTNAKSPDFKPLTHVDSAMPYTEPSGIYIPESSKEHTGNFGKYAHTNIKIRVPSGIAPNNITNLNQLSYPANENNSALANMIGETPASLACIYGIGPVTQPVGYWPECAPVNNPAFNAVGGNRAIALVLAYDNPTAVADLNFFSKFFGLPAANITVVKVTTALGGNCSNVSYNAGWALESAVDTQWSHAMAPSAKLFLIEACNNSTRQLMLAERVAIKMLNTVGGGQVSNSWGGSEWATESVEWDWVFRANWVSGKPVSFFFSSGDSGLDPLYPSSSPWVVSAGGTTINRNATTKNFVSESCWSGSGGGSSLYETYSSDLDNGGTGPWTNYQYPLFGQDNRKTPDLSFDADPASGAMVYWKGLWYVLGGTSLSAPALAGIVNNSNNRLGISPSVGGFFTAAENNLLYSQLLTFKDYKKNFYDITSGNNGTSAGTGWDYCTGVGSPRGKFGK